MLGIGIRRKSVLPAALVLAGVATWAHAAKTFNACMESTGDAYRSLHQGGEERTGHRLGTLCQPAGQDGAAGLVTSRQGPRRRMRVDDLQSPARRAAGGLRSTRPCALLSDHRSRELHQQHHHRQSVLSARSWGDVHYRGQTAQGLEIDNFAVTHTTRVIRGVTCVEVHDTVTVDGKLTEDTLDWFGQDKDGNVWYFGENSQEIADGLITGIEGSWIAGVDGAQPGIVMEAHPAVGDFYRQEFLARRCRGPGGSGEPDGVGHRSASGRNRSRIA